MASLALKVLHELYRNFFCICIWQHNELVSHLTGISLEASVPVEMEAPNSPLDVGLATRPLQTHTDLPPEYGGSDVNQRQSSSASTHQVSTQV